MVIKVNNNDLPIISVNNKKLFVKSVKANLKALRDIGFRVYHNIELEKEVNLVPKTVTNNQIQKVYDYKVGTQLTRNSLMKDISRCTIFSKYKAGDKKNPDSFRYLVNHHNTIKILDRLWCSEVINSCGTNLPNRMIFKSNLVKNFNPKILETAKYNTQTIDSVVLLDITRAFDSLEWDKLEELLISNLTRKINIEVATELVSQYMIILKNRELYYNSKRIHVSKGIPTGLPSSNLVFTLALEEIIYRWLYENNIQNNRDIVLNVYVDDIYLKILDKSRTKDIVYSLINMLTDYGLIINKSKSKADKKLGLDEIEKELKEGDYYLGIPFTRNIELYGKLIFSEFQMKMKKSWKEIYNILMDEDDEDRMKVFGFMIYKLSPLINKDNIDHNDIIYFIKKHYIKPTCCERITKGLINLLNKIGDYNGFEELK